MSQFMGLLGSKDSLPSNNKNELSHQHQQQGANSARF
jgi:hypothetical protein